MKKNRVCSKHGCPVKEEEAALGIKSSVKR